MEKLKSQVIHIEMDMFAPGLIFLMAENSSELYEMLLKKIVKVTPEDLKEYKLCYGENNDANGFVFTNKENGLWQMIVYIDRKDWRATLTHESLHAIEQQRVKGTTRRHCRRSSIKVSVCHYHQYHRQLRYQPVNMTTGLQTK